MKWLKYIRVVAAVAVIAPLTLYMAGWAGIFSPYAQWLENIQFIPAVIAHAAIILGGIILFTLIFGKVYCSVLCPLGIYMDLCMWIKRRLFKKYRDHRWMRPHSSLRYSILTVCVVTVILGILGLVALLDPYEIYRWVTACGLHAITGGTVFHPDLVMMTIGIVISSFWFLLITLTALLWGRLWCGVFCPVGAILGIVGKFSILRVRIDNLKCTSCGQCEKKCKATCISSSMKHVDSSRCVACYNCLGSCKYGALTYSPCKKGSGE